MDKRRLVRQVLLNRVQSKPEVMCGDLIDTDVKPPSATRKIELSGTRIGPRNTATLIGENAEHFTNHDNPCVLQARSGAWWRSHSLRECPVLDLLQSITIAFRDLKRVPTDAK